jgi:hypothetical protein
MYRLSASLTHPPFPSTACRALALSTVDPVFYVTAGADAVCRLWSRRSGQCLAQYAAVPDEVAAQALRARRGHGFGPARARADDTVLLCTPHGVSARVPADALLPRAPPLLPAADVLAPPRQWRPRPAGQPELDQSHAPPPAAPEVPLPLAGLLSAAAGGVPRGDVSAVTFAALLALDTKLVTADMGGVIRVRRLSYIYMLGPRIHAHRPPHRSGPPRTAPSPR